MASIANTESARKRISALAQLVRILMRDGITTTSALMEETGYSERAIWSAKGELRRSAAECRVQPSAVQPAAVEVQPSAVEGAAECRVHKERVSPHTPLPKEILPAAACKQAEKGEIEGLNGSTPKMVRLFAELIAGPLGTRTRSPRMTYWRATSSSTGRSASRSGSSSFGRRWLLKSTFATRCDCSMVS
jgi:hypothetical protein